MQMLYKEDYELHDVIEFLNEKYNQSTEVYPQKNEVEVINDHTAFIYAGCKAFVAIGKFVYTVHEDDLNWFLPNAKSKWDEYCDCRDNGWIMSESIALAKLSEYIEANYDNFKECHLIKK